MKQRVFTTASVRIPTIFLRLISTVIRCLAVILLGTNPNLSSYAASDGISSSQDSQQVSPPETTISANAPVVTPAPGTPKITATRNVSAQVIAPTAGLMELSTGFSRPITFDEVTAGTSVNETYRDRGIIFTGSGPHTVSDAAAPGSPVLSGTPTLEGDISGYFVRPGTDEPATVYFMGWNIGYLDSTESVRMDFFGPQGQSLFSLQNPRPGYLRYAARGGSAGIASWRFHIVAQELAGFGIDDLFFSIPGEEDSDREKGESSCARGNPINPAVGNKFQLETDYQGMRPLPLQITRAYNSSDGAWQFFTRVDHSQEERIAKVIRKDGKAITFTGAQNSNIWLPTSTDITGSLTSTRDVTGEIASWQFRALNDEVERYDGQGRLQRLESRSGLGHSFSNTAADIVVTHDLGGSLIYQLDAAGRITSATDPGGSNYAYSYNDDGMLQEVTYPADSGKKLYHYEDLTFPDLLTGITDADGNRFATWRYDGLRRAVSSEHAGGADLTRFDYTFTDDAIYPQTTVTNALGKQTTYHYVRVNGVRKVFYVSGHASENCVAANQRYTFDANAFIASYSDWNGNLTTFSRDSKGRETERVEAAGTLQGRQISTRWHKDFNLPEVVIEPLRTTYYIYDEAGNEVSRRIVDNSDD